MAEKSRPFTRIGSRHARTDVLTLRGHDTLEEIVGVRSFSETFFLTVTGRLPSEGETRCFDACLTVLMDHGITPGALVSRLVESQVPDDIQVPIAAGLLTVGNRHVGTMAGAGRLLAQVVDTDEDLAQWAKRVAEEHRAQKKRVPGFGHPHYDPVDPRAQRLFDVAAEAGCAGRGIEAIRALNDAVDAVMGRHLTLNVTGGMAAVLTDIRFPVEAMRGVAVVGRAAGLVGHIVEEKENGLSGAVIRYTDEEFSVDE
jgi:citrate synthase